MLRPRAMPRSPVSTPYCETVASAREAAAAVEPDLGPHHALVLPVDHPREHQPERDVVALGEAELAERDGDLHRPAAVVDDGLAAEDGVPREAVDGEPLVSDGRVVLGAERVHLEQVRVAAVAVGVEPDVDVVVAVVAPAALEVLGADQLGGSRRGW